MNTLISRFTIPIDRFSGAVLVTGASGCIGAWVVASLTASGVKVIASDLSVDRRRASLVMGAVAAADVIWECCDVTDFDSVHALAKKHDLQAIIHLAGLQVPFCAANPALGARVNVEGTINVLQTAREVGLKRVVYASSVAAHGLPPGGDFSETLYGVYKVANEHSAFVYWKDWQVPSVGLRPNVVYGLGRDQGMSSKNTAAIEAAVSGASFDIPYRGNYSWLYAGEAAAAFIAAVSQDGTGAPVFNLNGSCETIEAGLEILKQLAPHAEISCSGGEFPFPADLDDGPLRAYLPDYPSITVEEGITATYTALSVADATN
ncbi:MAG: SDR family oxidoreductase [Alphaproteobacteria bacterium]